MTQHTQGPWAVEGHWSQPSTGKAGHIISHGSTGDGPEGYVCRTEGTSDADARVIALAPKMLEALCQYRDDLRYPPEGGSVERRLAMVNALIAKAAGA